MGPCSALASMASVTRWREPWLGATVLAVAPLLRPPLHRAAFGVLTLCAFLAALPEWGANLGAGIAFAIAAAHVAAQQGSPRWRALKGFATRPHPYREYRPCASGTGPGAPELPTLAAPSGSNRSCRSSSESSC